ncbi:FtsH protease activity modulator HflK [Desulfatirhabdium butyrativorans]|jgi:membrane protease subunit HflK|uniref:FtsH protease activity modulator HflK n=1 Tax=Desulfatirhabdium butyrativorans TaxID=340467 RepID=UPI0004045F98|nr:FtsH protease activity modulator HflK [Desulfatirhabdium butyrativorans]
MSWDWDKLKEQQTRKAPGVPPQLNELAEKFKNIKLPGASVLIVVLLVLFLGSSAFYTVDVDEVGVIQRFGKYVRTTQPGLNFKWPAGIEKVTKVKVRRVFKEEFGFSSMRSDGERTKFSATSEDSNVALMLTGDLNVALAPWIVQYRIKDPYNYLFKVHDNRRLLMDMSEAAMRLVIGDRSVNEVISKREEIAVEAKNILQAELDNAESGISIVTIEMKRTNVPEPVQPSFNEVNQAIQEKEKLIYQAREEYNKAIPSAKGEAERTIRAAEGYALDRVNRAQGDVARFQSLYAEYQKAKDVTRRRLYLEMMSSIYPKIGEKIIVDADQKNLLPLLNLGKQRGDQK